jgi:hypothetical protein
LLATQIFTSALVFLVLTAYLFALRIYSSIAVIFYFCHLHIVLGLLGVSGVDLGMVVSLS